MKPADVLLSGPRLCLTPLHRAHIRTHFAWNNDAELNRLDSEPPYQRETYGAFARRFQALQKNGPARGHDFEIHRLPSTGGAKLLGVAYLTDLCGANRRGRVGMTIGAREEWGKGYGREAFGLVVAFGIEHLGLHRLVADAFAYNEPWRRLLRGAGFTLEGRLREHLHRDGRFWDKESYGLLESEHYGRRAQAA